MIFVPLKAGLAGCWPGLRIFFLLLLLVSLTGCAGRLNKAAEQFYAGEPDTALATLEKGDLFGKRNQLLFLMERGLVLHELGRYRESADILLQAAKLSNEFELVSFSQEVGSLVTNEWMKSYKGEHSERLWIHTYLMMNFLLLDEYDSAYVEARQALEEFGKNSEALQGDHFTRGLIALCFATVAEDNDAYLVYRRLAEDLLSPAPVANDLVEISRRLGQLDEVERFRKSLPSRVPAGAGELVLFVANGRIPGKRPGNVVLPPSIRFSFPRYEKQRTPQAKLAIRPAHQPLPPLSTDLGTIAANSLEQRKLKIIVKETARVAAKEAIAQNVGSQHGDTAEAVVRLSLFLLEEPDTRSWQTLPGRLTLVRVPLPAGRHQLRLQVSGAWQLGAPEIALPEFQLRPGQKVFHSLRLL